MDGLDLSGASWRKSSRSDATRECVEVAAVASHVPIRDSKATDVGTLLVTPIAWRALLHSLGARANG
ncbi:DUF397 domain-containing protein [Actinomadura logoneensis]|uniref:DUF397 domain-containing protein n=1 Tax=Actinomadura logoneensis TaxID=2293572 RepID=A0A372JTT0_9ACTN|nr:DUF397 domain-containing protein [Actinomadura logoneensis]RFU42768.1 DUF397 domain-containing protein [Actinomadura logoneensis]